MSNDSDQSILDYDKSVLDTLTHIENIQVTFSLQSYASAGAIFLAHFANPDKISIGVTALLVLVVGLVFLSAIWSNGYRYKILFNMHRIARDEWLKKQKDLRSALYRDSACKKYLTSKSPISTWPMLVINALPALSAIVVYLYPRIIG